MDITPFRLPSELLITTLCSRFPCRDSQIRSLAILLSPSIASPRNLLLHGLEATGKSAITQALLSALSQPQDLDHDALQQRVYGDDTPIKYAILRSSAYITARHLLEATIAAVASAVEWNDNIGRCDNLSQFVVELDRILRGTQGDGNSSRKFFLVFDGIDTQREAPATLLPALARLSEIIPDLTTIFIVTNPRPRMLHTDHVPHIDFPAYKKQEAIQILSMNPPPAPHKDDLANGNGPRVNDLWPKFVSTVWDSLSKYSGRDVLSLRDTALALWPTFVSNLPSGTHPLPNFSKLLISNRTLFQNEKTLIPSIAPSTTSSAPTANQSIQKSSAGLATQLPLTSRLILISAYLASHVPSRLDLQVFSSTLQARRKKRGGGTALARPGRATHRKISRKLLGPQSFVLERMFAIFWALVSESHARGRITSSGADLHMAVATLVSLRLVARCSGGGDVLDANGKFRVNIGWEVVRGVGRSVGVEVEDFLVD